SMIARWLAIRTSGRNLTALARQWRISAVEDETLVRAILDKAVTKGDDIAVMECVVAVMNRHTENLEPLITNSFEPGLRYLTERDDARRVNGAWFTTEAKTFFGNLSEETVGLVLDNLMSIARLDTHAEWILTHIAKGHAAAVWAYLGRRVLDRGRERGHQ